jgi:hypothetical protein
MRDEDFRILISYPEKYTGSGTCSVMQFLWLKVPVPTLKNTLPVYSIYTTGTAIILNGKITKCITF